MGSDPIKKRGCLLGQPRRNAVQIEEQDKRTEELDEYKVHVKTKQFAEEVAKEKFGLIYPNELVLKPEK